MDEALLKALYDLWTAVRSDLPFNTELGIVKYWLEHRAELGSPVGPEQYDAASDTRYQAFAHGIVKYPSDGRVEVL